MKNRNRRRALARGFTLLEMMLVVVIMGVLMSIVAWNILGQGEDAKRKATIASLKTVEGMLTQYNLEYGAYPSSLTGLVPKYTKKIPQDAWKRDLVYSVSQGGQHPFELYSNGPTADGGDSAKMIDIWHADDPQ